MFVKMFVITVILFVRIFYASKTVETIKTSEVCLKLLLPMLLIVGVILGLLFVLNDYANSTLLKVVNTVVLEFR